MGESASPVKGNLIRQPGEMADEAKRRDQNRNPH
jgi:hypothetical protein